jgi:hypothetical protein
MKNVKILAIKKVAGRKIPFEMDCGLAAKITEKYQCRLVDLLGKEITLDETETWEYLRINMLERDMKVMLSNPLYHSISLVNTDFVGRHVYLKYWNSWERSRLAKYIKTKQVKVSYIVTDIQLPVERTRTITEFCGWKSITSKY